MYGESRKVFTKKFNMCNHLEIKLGGKNYDASYENKQLDSVSF